MSADSQNWGYGKSLEWAAFVRAGTSSPYLSVMPSEDGNSATFPLMLDQAGFSSAVKAYQQWRGLTADGVLGPGTWRRLLPDYGDRFSTAQLQRFRQLLGDTGVKTGGAAPPVTTSEGTSSWKTWAGLAAGVVVVGGIIYVSMKEGDGLSGADCGTFCDKRGFTGFAHGMCVRDCNKQNDMYSKAGLGSCGCKRKSKRGRRR